MKRHLLLLVVLCSYIISTAQSREQVLDYYRKVNLAELALCDSNFAQANKFYGEAFAINNKKSFYGDLENAFFSAMDSHEYPLAEKYMAQLMRRGLDSENVSHIVKAYTGEELKRVKSLMNKYPNHMEAIKNEALVKELNLMVRWDQDVRRYYYDIMNLSDYMTDSTFKVDAINTRHLLKIIKEKGIPCEAIKKETDYWIIIWHNRGADFGGYAGNIFDTILYKGIFNFSYDARSFAVIIDGSHFRSSFSYGNVVLHFPLSVWGAAYQHKTYAEVYDDTSEARINKERAKIGLASLADFRRKLDASNEGVDSNSILHKYFLSSEMNVLEEDNEEKLKQWLQTKGKDAKVKPPYNFKALEHAIEIGQLDNYTVGQSSYGDVTKWFDHFNKEYNAGSIYLTNWKDGRPSLNWNCHARVIDNPKENLKTETGRHNKAQFVQGYHLFVDDCYELPFYIRNIIFLFGPDDRLISFTANVATRFNTLVTHYCGKPDSFTIRYTTQYWQNDKRYKITLATKKYTWIKDNIKVQVTVMDQLDKDGRKTTTATYQMTDTPQYAAYLQKVDEEKKKLDKEYAEVEKR